MKIQFLLLPAVLGSWWNPKTWVSTVVNKVKETVKPVASVKSDSYAHTRLTSTTDILEDIGLDDVWSLFTAKCFVYKVGAFRQTK